MISLLSNCNAPKNDTVSIGCCRISIRHIMIAALVAEVILYAIGLAIYYEMFQDYTFKHSMIFLGVASFILVMDIALSIIVCCTYNNQQAIEAEAYIANLLAEQRRQWERKPDELGQRMKPES